MKRAGGLLLCGLLAMVAVSARAADVWGAIPTISPSTTYSANRLCYTDGRDIACNATAPYVTSGGLLGIGTSNPQTALEVNGTISASGLTVNGQPVTGGGSADRIVSTSANVVAYAGGTVSITTGGVSGTAYFDSVGRLVAPGVSTTGVISGTYGYYTYRLGIGTAPSTYLDVLGSGAGPWVTFQGGNDVYQNTALRLLDNGTNANNVNILDFAHSNGGSPASVARIKSENLALDAATGARMTLETASNNAGSWNTNQLTLYNNGRVGIGTATPTTTLEVMGTISATNLVVNGVSITGSGSADRIVSTSANVMAYAGGTVSITTGGVSGTAYFDTAGRLVLPGISTTTAQASFTSIYTSGVAGFGPLSTSSTFPGATLSAVSTGNGRWLDSPVVANIGASDFSPWLLTFTNSSLGAENGAGIYLGDDTPGGSLWFVTSNGIGGVGAYFGIDRQGISTEGDALVAGTASSTNLYAKAASFTTLTVGGVPITGGGSGSADRIVSTSANVVAYAGGTVSITTGGVSGTAYFDTTGRLVLPGISTTTSQVSFTSVYASGKVSVAGTISANVIGVTALQIVSQSTSPVSCNSANSGSLRYNSPTTTVELCNGSGWIPMGMGIPQGTISAFASTTCPAGWSEYTAARGVFLRGIDNGAGYDPSGTRAPGNYQNDAFQDHTHGTYATDYGGTNDGTTAQAANSYKQNGWDTTGAVTGRVSTETRPKNVAVTFCQFNGTSNGWSILSSSSPEFWLTLNGTDIYRTSGNVGIGTSTPQTTLDVSGTIKASTIESTSGGFKFPDGTVQTTKYSASQCVRKSCSGGDWTTCTCDAGYYLTGGGCKATGSPYYFQESTPKSNVQWSCGGAGGSKSIDIICCP